MKRNFFSIIALLMAMLFIYGMAPQQAKDNFEKQWTQVKKLKEQGLPQSALKIVNKIYRHAKIQENEQQMVKALLYQASLKSTFEEEYLPKAITTFEKELKISGEPEKSILYSLLGQMYQSYYQRNRYKILDRSIVKNSHEDKIQTWDAYRFQKKIKNDYLLSVVNKKLLKTIKLKDFSDIISPDKPEPYKVQPTLFDLLAQRAINYFSSSDAAIFDFTKTALDTSYLLPVREFLTMNFHRENTDNKMAVLRLFKEILQLHLQNKDTVALVNADLKRLAYVKEHLTDAKTGEKAYTKALETLLNKVHTSEAMMQVAFKLAENQFNSASGYGAANTTKHGFGFVKAEQICLQAIIAFPHSKWADACRGIIEKIHRPELNFKLASENIPGRPFLIRCNFKNINTLYVKLVPSPFEINPEDWQTTQKKIKNLRKQKGVYNTTFALPQWRDYRKHSTVMEIPKLPVGQYIIFLSDDKSFSKKKTVVFKQVQITSLSYLVKKNSDDKTMDVYVLNRESGKPVADAAIVVYRQEYNRHQSNYKAIKTGDYQTDKQGFVKIPIEIQGFSGKYLLDISKNNDHYYAYEPVWFWNTQSENKPVIKNHFFTDRAIYRPGQTVYFKGILIKQFKNKAVVLQDKDVSVELLDANRKKVGMLQLRTNTYGSVQGSFVLPTGKLNGRFTLHSTNGSITFRVEEYKRPTFRVEFDTLSGKHKLNERVKVTGRATDFAGSPLTGAKVQFRVSRKPFIITPYYNWYIPYPQASRETEITNGKLITGDDGTFEITFIALPDENKPETVNFYYTVSADVTDVTGEVHSTKMVVPIGKNPYVLHIDVGEVINREKNSGITILAKNLSGKSVNVKAKLTLYKLTPPKRVLTARLWEKPDTLLISKEKFQRDFPHNPYGNESNKEKWSKEELITKNIHINGNGNFLTKKMQSEKPGEYLITVVSTAPDGTVITDKRFVTLYSEKLKHVPVKNVLWFTVNKTKAEPGETVKLLLGSAAKDTRVLLEIVSGKKYIKQEWIQLGKKQKTVELPIEESNRGNIVVKVTTVRFNRSFHSMQVINVPFNNKKLHITLETKRDYLTPGKKEEWRVNIRGYKGEKVAAELLTTMYDASLDEFATNQWNLNLYYPHRPIKTWNANGFGIVNGSGLFRPKTKYYTTPNVIYPHINWFGNQMGIGGQTFRMVGKSAAMEMMNKNVSGMVVPVTAQSLGKKPPSFDGKKILVSPSPLEKQTQEKFQYRKNFNETAFFYPQLHTDSLGNVSFTFTTPDALTEWKLMMLAHTRDLKTGTLIQTIKAHKQLMIILNKPRFVRVGDILEFSGKVVNFTKKATSANITLEFFNPIDNSPLAIMDGKSKTHFNVKIFAGQSMGFSQKITIPQGIDLLAFRIKAESDDYTDGVQDILPVLPEKMLVTETMPFTVQGNSSKTFRFDKLINTGKAMQASAVDNYRYTVEFTSHPVWYAVQALPYLAKPRFASTQNLFNRYYANTIASGIVNKYPRIKTVLEQWKNRSPDAFLSNLQKNQKLKGILLDATPWVLEAENESEQKRRISLLFDMNNLSNQLIESLQKLQNRQLPSGAWSWFNGMYEDRYVTQSIVAGFARLRKMNFVNPSDSQVVWNILQKSIYYLDNQITKDYNDLKKQKNVSLKKKYIGSLQINYLYARTAFLDLFPVKDNNKEAFEYYAGQARHYWIEQNIYLQAMTAMVMDRLNYRNEAEGIIRSLTERSLTSDEMGMYWRTENGWYWYQAPVETEVIIMEAYSEVMHDRKSVEKMKIWLLKNKQTNRWKTSTATANAVFGLLMRGNELLKETKDVLVSVGGKPLKSETKNAQAGTGYIEKSWMRKEITPDMGIIKISNPNHSIAWGAAYYQYFENLDKIETHQTDLQVHKKYFVEKLTPEGTVIEPLLSDETLKPGQKIVVRLVINSDRDMEYIHLKDMRAATFEPVESLSGTQFKGGLMYYENIKDASVDFFISRLPKGTHVLEYSLRVTQKGSFSAGIATIQSLYAPEFAAHSQGRNITVE